MNGKSIQERYAPQNACFGCGPLNPQGLRIRSFPADDGRPGELVAHWTPAKHHEAFDGILNGGIIGALLDCHSNWAAVCHLMQRDRLDSPPCCVTAELQVRMLAPTPTSAALTVRAWPASSERSRVTVEATLGLGDAVSATCTGVFVAVKPEHPAYHRW